MKILGLLIATPFVWMMLSVTLSVISEKKYGKDYMDTAVVVSFFLLMFVWGIGLFLTY